MNEIQELYERANKLYEEKKFEEALELVKEIKQRDPECKPVYILEIRILDALKRHIKLIAAIKKILPLINITDNKGRELAADLLDILAHAQGYLAMHNEAFKSIKLAAQMTSKNSWTRHRWSVAIFCANQMENFSATDFQVLYSAYKKCFDDITPYPKKFYEREKIRVGFISADFRQHAAMNWSWALVAGLDKSKFETYFYSSSEKTDKITEFLRRAADGWHDIRELTDEQAAKQIRDDEIDILFDLSGYTRGSRIFVEAYRPASVQICGIGYINSTGLDFMDYFLTDVYCVGDENYFTEKLIVMPQTHICYAPTTKFEPAAEPPCVKNNFVTFGSFNRCNKFTDSILRAWKKILDAVPNSRLILKNIFFNGEDERKYFGERLESYGFDLSRIELRPASSDYMREYDDVDIALDTFPYTGGVTTCDALYMGVPVVSLFGDRHGTRFGLSILENVGLGGLAVDSYDAYINTAIDLAADKNSLIAMRKELRGLMLNSPLMDAKTYINDIQEVFIKILNDARQ